MKILEIENPIPDVINSEYSLYDESKIITNGYFYTYNKEHVYSPAILTLYQKDFNFKINYKVWVVFNLDKFRAFVKRLNNENCSLWGNIVDEVFLYESISRPKVNVEYRINDQVAPGIVVSIGDEAESLKEDMQNGISIEKWKIIRENFNIQS